MVIDKNQPNRTNRIKLGCPIVISPMHGSLAGRTLLAWDRNLTFLLKQCFQILIPLTYLLTCSLWYWKWCLSTLNANPLNNPNPASNSGFILVQSRNPPGYSVDEIISRGTVVKLVQVLGTFSQGLTLKVGEPPPDAQPCAWSAQELLSNIYPVNISDSMGFILVIYIVQVYLWPWKANSRKGEVEYSFNSRIGTIELIELKISIFY